MFRRLVFYLLIAVFSFFLSTAYAVTELSQTYSYSNDTGQEVNVYVSTTTVIPGINKILSFTVTPSRNDSHSPYASIWDGNSSTTRIKLLGE